MGMSRGSFVQPRTREEDAVPACVRWLSVAVIVPARNEAGLIARSMVSLAAQDYPGEFSIILVDDQSGDGTADAARSLGCSRLAVLTGGTRPSGWTGKLWALQQGVAQASRGQGPDYLWFTDADIAHAPDDLRRLIPRA